jgi:hypothetical protein
MVGAGRCCPRLWREMIHLNGNTPPNRGGTGSAPPRSARPTPKSHREGDAVSTTSGCHVGYVSQASSTVASTRVTSLARFHTGRVYCRLGCSDTLTLAWHMNGLPRDVGINVVANLIANAVTAAVLYLLGVAGGLLPYSTLLVNAAILTIAGVMLPATLGASIVKAVRPSLISKTREYRISLTFAYIASIMVPLQIIYMSMKQERSATAIIQVALMALFFTSVQMWIWRERHTHHTTKEIAERQALIRGSRMRRASREPRILRRHRLPQRPPRRSAAR